jgi:hypothetical protein
MKMHIVFTKEIDKNAVDNDIPQKAEKDLKLYNELGKKINVLTDYFRENGYGAHASHPMLEFFNMMVSLQEGLNVLFELLTLSLHDESLIKIYREDYNEKFDSFQIFLQNQQEKGKIRDDVDANILAQLLIALSTDITMQLVIGFDEVKIHENGQTHCKQY